MSGKLPSGELKRFEERTGMIVDVLRDKDHVQWWRKAPFEDGIFECTIGDRVMHIDELIH